MRSPIPHARRHARKPEPFEVDPVAVFLARITRLAA
jgi:hypothetical protein